MVTKQTTSSKQIKQSTKKVGRPQKYSSTLVKAVLEDIQSGKTVIEAIKKNNLSYTGFTYYLDKDKDLKRDYYSAREWATEYQQQEKKEKFKQYFDKVERGEKLTLQEMKLFEIYVKDVQYFAGKTAPSQYGTDKEKASMAIQTSSGEKILFEWGK